MHFDDPFTPISGPHNANANRACLSSAADSCFVILLCSPIFFWNDISLNRVYFFRIIDETMYFI